MQQLAILVLLPCLAMALPNRLVVVNRPAAAAVAREKREGSDAGSPHITRLAVESWIQFRYARTIIESDMKNPGSAAASLEFQAVIPDSAFISNFSMIVNGKELVAEVKEKEEAKNEYNEAVASGQGAGLVEKQKLRNANIFTVATNVEPEAKVTFRLTYDELLERRQGQYEHVINIRPGQIVNNYTVVVHINESLPLTSLTVPDLRESNDVDFEENNQQNPVAVVEKLVDNDSSKARITFKLDKEYQESVGGSSGLSGELSVLYDVDRSGQANEVQVIDGYFVHFFAPENLPVLPKHVIFVLDVSGSMTGEKLQQMKDAMFTIMDDMGDADYFNIFSFSSFVHLWDKDQTELVETASNQTMPLEATKENKREAVDYIFDLSAEGGTNIHDALVDALTLADNVIESKDLPDDVQTMIVFLTDGNPTEGEVNPEKIRKSVNDANTFAQVPIFGIAFGRDADFNLLKDVSGDTRSFSKQIYLGSDAALQLEDFFALISSPLISDLSFDYVGSAVDNTSLSNADLKTFFKGGEFIVAGKLLPDDTADSTVSVTVTGLGAASSEFINDFTICLRPVPYSEEGDTPVETGFLPVDPPCINPNPLPPRSASQNFLKNLYAYLNIKQLLKEEDPDSKARAVQLALENNFVTDVTSLLVIQPDSDEVTVPSLAPPVQDNGIGIFSKFGVSPIVAFNAPPIDYSYDYADSFVRPQQPPPPATSNGNKTPTTTTFAPISTSTSVRDLFDANHSMDENDEEYDEVAEVEEQECVGNITFFSKTYYRGDSFTLSESTNSTELGGRGEAAVTARIEGDCCWKLTTATEEEEEEEEEEPAGEAQAVEEFVQLMPGTEYDHADSLGRLRRNVKTVHKINCST